MLKGANTPKVSVEEGLKILDHEVQQIGNYRIIRPLGQGGFGVVYLGEHIHLGTQAAVKVLRLSNQLTEQALINFREEAKIIAKLEHAHIVRVHDFDILDGSPYLVMDYAPGGTLRDRYPSGTTLPSANIIDHVKQVSSALQYAHSRKLIHRDVKPENMLVASNGDILLSDFGLAVTAHSTESQIPQNAAGTWAYMAPEQIQGNPRPASDQYSLGIVVYEWICGCRPFGGSPEALVMQHLNNPPAPLHDKIPSIYPPVEDVVLKALAKNPQERFETVEAFSKALEEAFMAQEAVVPSASTQLEIQSSVSSPQESDAPALSVGTLLCKYPSSYYWKRCPLAWSPDSSYFAIGDENGYVRIWNIPDEEETFKYRGHQSVKTVLWNLDGKFIFSAGTEGTIQKWDIQTGRKVLTLKGHMDWVNSLALAPSGKFIASGGNDRTIIVWNLETRKQYFKYTGHTSTVHTVSWSPGSTQIASADDESVQVWDVSKKEEEFTFFHSVDSLAWSPDGSYIGSGKAYMDFQIWDPYTGITISCYNPHLTYQNASAGLFAWSPDGKYIACSINEEVKNKNGTTSLIGNKIHIWDVANKQVLFIYEGHSDTVVGIAWSPDGKYIASSSSNNGIHIWQAI